MKIKEATEIGFVTCLGVMSSEYPILYGNCFSMIADHKEYKIVNFIYENIEEAIKRGVSYPIKIGLLSDRLAVIHDERIPDDWYNDHFCEICCSTEFLPIQQILAHQRQEKRGERILIGRLVGYDHNKQPKL